MGCTIILGSGKTAHIDGPGARPCRHCRVLAESLCDFMMPNGKTCDMPLCGHHACVQGRWEDDRDYCPAHHLASSQALAVPRMSRDRLALCCDRASAAVDEATRSHREKTNLLHAELPRDEFQRVHAAAFARAERETRPSTQADATPRSGYLF